MKTLVNGSRVRHGRLLLGVLVLSLAAVLSFAAQPSRADGGCTCHTATPPSGGAPAAHEPFVTGAGACATCHRGMTVPHPKVVEPKLGLGASYESAGGKEWVGLGGRLAGPRGRGLNGVVVYVQQRIPGTTAFAAVTTLTTHRVKQVPLTAGYGRPDGWFGGRIGTPVWGAAYRAISRGVGGKTVVRPALAETVIWPAFGVAVRGPDKNGDLAFGQSVTAYGLALPAALLAGEKVKLTLLQGWKVRIAGEATIGSDGSYSWTVTPAARGKRYKVYATLPATEEHQGVTRGTHPNFRVN